MPLVAKSLITTVAGLMVTCCAIGVPLTLVDGGQSDISNVVTSVPKELNTTSEGGGHSVKQTDEKLTKLTDYLIEKLQTTSASESPVEISVQKSNGAWSYDQELTTNESSENENIRVNLKVALEYVSKEWTEKQWSSTWSGQYWGTSWIDSQSNPKHNVVMTGVDSLQNHKKHILLKQDLKLDDSKSYVVGSYEVKSKGENNASTGELSLGVKSCEQGVAPQCQLQKQLEESEVKVKLKFTNS